MTMTDYEPLIRTLLNKNSWQAQIPRNPFAQRKMVDQLMTISRPFELSQTYEQLEGIYLKDKFGDRKILPIHKIDNPIQGMIHLYKGDITTIECDAIVNAANSQMLGCFIPGHHCIDNAIHSAAGLGLRQECHLLMEEQGYPEPVGKAKITSGYHLPAKYVVHTVGPNLRDCNPPTRAEASRQLAQCYEACLDGINDYPDIHNIVFCSISTGVFGFPIEEASGLAIATIRQWLRTHHHHLTKVVIDVFSEEDYDVYYQYRDNKSN